VGRWIVSFIACGKIAEWLVLMGKENMCINKQKIKRYTPCNYSFSKR